MECPVLREGVAVSHFASLAPSLCAVPVRPIAASSLREEGEPLLWWENIRSHESRINLYEMFSLYFCPCGLALGVSTVRGSEEWCGWCKLELSGRRTRREPKGPKNTGRWQRGSIPENDPITLLMTLGHLWAVHAWIWPCTAYPRHWVLIFGRSHHQPQDWPLGAICIGQIWMALRRVWKLIWLCKHTPWETDRDL